VPSPREPGPGAAQPNRKCERFWTLPADFEFELGSGVGSGERSDPLCLCARELRSGREIRLWRGEFGPKPPFPTGPNRLFTAFYVSAELGCFRALSWPMPQRILDLFTEFRCGTNGLAVPAGNGLIGALTAFGLDTMGATEKKELQTAIGNGTWPGRHTPQEISDYCMSDVDALARLLPVMAPRIDLPRSLLRGRYMAAAARMEYAGVPIDVPMLEKLRRHWAAIQDKLIEHITPTMASTTDALSRKRNLKPTWFVPAFLGRGLKAGALRWMKTPSVKWRRRTRQYRHCVSCAVHLPNCGLTISPSDVTGAVV
jgi:hypothetical protein